MKEAHRLRPRRRGRGVLPAAAAGLAGLCFLGGWLLFQHFYGLLRHPAEAEEARPVSSAAPDIHAASPAPAAPQRVNLLLLGVDDRDDALRERTDVMLLVTLDAEARTIWLTSFLRDIYLNVPCCGYQRLNAANVYGGADGVTEALRSAFGVAVDNYAYVNFYSFIDAVDALGGVELPMTAEEARTVNLWTGDQNVAGVSHASLLPCADGVYQLDGAQALAYCRSRDIGADFGRTERQRRLLGAVWDKVKNSSLPNQTRLLERLLPEITTDLSERACLNLLLAAGQAVNYELVSQRVPADGTFTETVVDGMDVLSLDWEANRALLRDTVGAAA